MKLLVLDFETFFSDTYTLKKTTTEAYVRDPQFQALLVGAYEPETDRKGWIPNERIAEAFARVDWADTAVLAHHAHFDGLILAHHYGIKPAMWLDTLSMARLVHGNGSVGGSLVKLAAHYGLSEKSVPYQAFKGRRWENLSPALRAELGDGCLQDCVLTYQIFRKMVEGFPREELKVIDLTVRMFTEPQLIGNAAEFERLKMVEWTSKATALAALGVTAADLQSADKFQALLEAEGVEVEMKPGKNGRIPAIAATDGFMRDLCEHQDERVSALAQARLEVRSTIDETRAGRFAGMARRGPLPVYLQYCGAQTLRWSGGDKVNFQNMRRGSELRKAISAPDGYLLAIIDLSQIEARLLAYLAGQTDLVARFAAGEDPYLPVASAFYGEAVDKADKARRGLGKLLVLSCGYGSGGPTIVRTAAKGTYGPSLTLSAEEGMHARNTYRRENERIVAYWKECDEVLRQLATLDQHTLKSWQPSMIVGPGYIQLPNGARMLYDLQWNDAERSWERRTRSGWRRIWGGVLAQNLCEAFGRLLISQAMLRIAAKGFKTVLTTHDEIVVLVPEKPPWTLWASACPEDELMYLEHEITTVPDYLPGLPLAAEGHLSRCYDK